MNAIVVVDQNWGIGKNGNLLCHLPSDLKYFKEKTQGKTIVFGRKTLESFPGGNPLPKRENIVLTRNEDYTKEGCRCLNSKEHLLSNLEGKDKKEVFIAGGAEIYRELFNECSTFFVTKILKEFDADRFFPNLDQDENFEATYRGAVQEENNIRYQFCIYERI